MLRQGGLPDVTVREWQEGDEPEASITFVAAYTDEGRSYVADVLVAKTGDGALWVSYSAPEADYSAERSRVLFAAMLGSLAEGDESVPPEAALPELGSGQMDRNARAFVFVLEFAMGAPFSSAQEKVILDAFQADIGQLSAQDQAAFDAYPDLVAKIRRLGEADVEGYRHSLRETLREVVGEAGDSPAFRVLTEELDRSGEVVAAGPPPLVRAAAQAMGEMLAYGRLLQEDPTAMPDSLDPEVAAAIRDEAIEAWDTLDDNTQKLVADAPGIWMVARTVLRDGQPAEQAALRRQIEALAAVQIQATPPPAAPDQPAPDDPNEGGESKPTSWVTHNALMEMNQMTFNTNMWSNGYSGWTPLGKIW